MTRLTIVTELLSPTVAVAISSPSIIILKPALYDPLVLIDQLIHLNSSTTLFLEGLRGESLKVMVESQTENGESADCTIVRVVRLFFESSEIPLLYCRSNMNKYQLTKEEYRLLKEEKLPIGMVFHQLNEGVRIKKRNISIGTAIDRDIALSLNVRSDIVFKKNYEYWVGDRKVGYISEFFNHESLSRV